jgi:hypothetical protein
MTDARWIAAALLQALGSYAWAADPACLPQVSVPLRVHLGDAAPQAAWLEGSLEIPLMLVSSGSRQMLWSAGAGPAIVQVFPDMTAAFTGSLAAVDLDGDGLHDRVYAGDMAARVWRFDLHHGAEPARWVTGGIFADFSNSEGRSFLAAPDVSLSAPAGATPWINIAIGTASPGNPAASNRFYALRDHAAHESWDSAQYQHWQPLREPDLVRVEAVIRDLESAPLADTAGPGWYVELGNGHVITPAITVADRTTVVIAAALPRRGACEVFVRTATFDLARQRVAPGAIPGEWSTRLVAPIATTARFGFGRPVDGIAPCLVAGQRIAACDVDTRPRKTWWRQSDAQ